MGAPVAASSMTSSSASATGCDADPFLVVDEPLHAGREGPGLRERGFGTASDPVGNKKVRGMCRKSQLVSLLLRKQHFTGQDEGRLCVCLPHLISLSLSLSLSHLLPRSLDACV